MLERAATEPFADVQVDESELAQSLDYWVGFKGAACAAFIVWQKRKALRRGEMVDFRIPRTAKTPGWFRVGIETLQRREKWSVAVMSGGAFGPFRVYRVKWKGHGKCRSKPRWAPHVVGTYDERAVDPETGAPEEQKFSIHCSVCGATHGPTTCTSGLVRQRIASFALAHGHGRKPLDEKVSPR